MAILLIHLRRILLLVTVVYLAGVFVRRLLYGGTAAVLRSSRSAGSFLFAKRLHLQPWFYIYTFYLYALVDGIVDWNQLNLFDVLHR
ncbi:uncharacterized protein LOC128727070 [Anopheles nili]|uniref:uncharacterized protein LOC128727070 n=1 Tax=Anopheles nili TaxID=185578 RepID=UPI00237A8C48|nr:uncharacterized protein LOC128727070 [Anopheles nili]